jgi:hypothetical protein
MTTDPGVGNMEKVVEGEEVKTKLRDIRGFQNSKSDARLIAA